MFYNEVLPLTRRQIDVPYKLIAHTGKVPRELAKLNEAVLSGTIAVVNGWAVSNLQIRYNGLLVRELRKGQFTVWRINESPAIFEGGVIDTFFATDLNSILSFSQDFKLDQERLQLSATVAQEQVIVSEEEQQRAKHAAALESRKRSEDRVLQQKKRKRKAKDAE